MFHVTDDTNRRHPGVDECQPYVPFASYTSIYFVRKPFSVVKAPMQDALGLSMNTVAGIDSAFLGLYALGQLTLPALGDKLGARKMLVGLALPGVRDWLHCRVYCVVIKLVFFFVTPLPGLSDWLHVYCV
jgi:sugar phosphate permease